MFTDVTPYSEYAIEDLLKLVYALEKPDPLIMELAFRLEQAGMYA